MKELPPHLEYFKIDRGKRASLNKMNEELPASADMAIKRLQDKFAEPRVHGQVVFTTEGKFDVLVYRADLYHPSEDQREKP